MKIAVTLNEIETGWKERFAKKYEIRLCQQASDKFRCLSFSRSFFSGLRRFCFSDMKGNELGKTNRAIFSGCV